MIWNVREAAASRVVPVTSVSCSVRLIFVIRAAPVDGVSRNARDTAVISIVPVATVTYSVRVITRCASRAVYLKRTSVP